MKLLLKNKKIIIAAAIAAVALIAAVIIFTARKKSEKSDAEKNTAQREYKVTESKFTRSVDISGYLEPSDTQNVQFRGTGAITGVFVKEGDRVKKGDLLATIDDANEQYSVTKARQELEKARLVGNDRETELLEMQLRSAENNLSYTRAIANFDGVVVEVNIDVGDYAKAGETLNLIKLVDINTLEAEVEIDEIDMSVISENMPIELDFDSLPGEKVKAYVSYIPTLGTYNSTTGIGGKKVKICIPEPPAGIYPGYSFSATITGSSETVYTLVPNSAVKSTRGKTYVIRKNADGTTEQIEVSVRYLGEGVSQLLTGDLKIGDTLLGNTSATLTEKMSQGPGGGGGMGGGMPGGGGMPR